MPTQNSFGSVQHMSRPRVENVKNKAMIGEDYPLLLLGDVSNEEDTSPRQVNESHLKRYRRWRSSEPRQSPRPLLQRLSSFRTTLKPNFGNFRSSFRKLSCFKGEKDEDVPIMDVPRHKSIDIGVGLARKMSLFIFTKKTVSVHPYHPFTPSQTTRKIYIFSEDKH